MCTRTCFFFFFKQKTAYEIDCDWSSDVCSSDLAEARDSLEQITSLPVWGLRAPNFSIGDAVLDCLAEAGYWYDSSFYQFKAHDRYGRLATPIDPDVPVVSVDRKSTRLNSSHSQISYAVFCLKKKY